MSELPAIALIEFSSIAAGTFAADAMVKEASVQILRIGTIQPGRFLVLIGGMTAEVELAYKAGIRAGTPQVLDDVFLPDAHSDVVKGIDGKQLAKASDAMLTLETSTSTAIIRAADAMAKGALVSLMELRLGDGLGGKGFARFVGSRSDSEAALQIASEALAGRDVQLCESIVSRIDEALAERLADSSRFDGSSK
ncbi:MAG: propanediol utilization: polyhedral bodies pduT [Phycisphaerae bacterium]|nr:MAG: propanediol utilization: polyhedral bodies pduT [Phycisphaerae bacterium]